MGSRIFSSSDALIKHIAQEVCGLNPEMPDYITLPLFIHEILKSSLALSRVQKQFSHSPAYVTSKRLASIFKNFYAFSQLPEQDKYSYQKQLFIQLNSYFQPLDSLFQAILSKIQTKQYDRTLHVFGCSHLPYHIATFFESLSRFFPVYFYALAPTKEFFGDLQSDKLIHLHYRNNSLNPIDTYNQYANPDRPTLLANLSYKMQMFQNFCIDHNVESLDFFTPKQSSQTVPSLQYIQGTFASLHPICPQEIKKRKQTLHVQRVYHESREVQEVFTKVMRLINNNIDPRGIFIVSPQIDAYLPYLKATFSSYLPLYFINQETSQTKTFKEKILLLSSLMQTRGNIYPLLQILIHEDCIVPISSEHRASIQTTLFDTWETIPHKDPHPLNTLILKLIEQHPFTEMNDYISLFDIWESLLPLLDTIQKLLENIDPAREISYSEHLQIFDTTANALFKLSAADNEQLALFNHHISSQQIRSFTCSLSFFTDFFLDFLSNFRNTSPLHQPGPFVSSLNDVSFLPKQYTFILGANGSRNTDFDVSELLALKERNTVSSPEDEENFHFLQTLITTRSELHISYVSSKHEPSAPKYFVQALLDVTHLQEEPLTTPMYYASSFKRTISLHASQKHFFSIAKNLTEPSPTPLPCFIQQKEEAPLPRAQHHTIQSISSLLLNPFKAFLNAQYETKIYTPKSLQTSQDQIFPHEKYIFSLWNALVLDQTPSLYKYSSDFSQKTCEAYEHLLRTFIDQKNENPNTALSTIILTPYLFHSPHTQAVTYHSPLRLHVGNQDIHIQGEIGAVHKNGIYVCNMNPSHALSLSPTSAASFTKQKALLEGLLALATLQMAEILPPHATLDILTLKKDSIIVTREPVLFTDPKEFLHRALEMCQRFQTTPYPITSLYKDISLDKKRSDLEKHQKDPSSQDCFFFYQRDLCEFSMPSEEDFLLFQSIIPQKKNKK